MIRGISHGRYINVVGGQPPSTYVNNYSGAQGIGNVRYNTVNQNFEVYDGNTWMSIANNYATIELTPEAQNLLDWVKQKRDDELRVKELAKNNPTIADALNKVTEAQSELDMLLVLTKVEE